MLLARLLDLLIMGGFCMFGFLMGGRPALFLLRSCWGLLEGFMPIRSRAWLGVENEGMEQEDLKLQLLERRFSFRYGGRFVGN